MWRVSVWCRSYRWAVDIQDNPSCVSLGDWGCCRPYTWVVRRTSHGRRCIVFDRHREGSGVYSTEIENEWVLIATCKQLVWSIRIGRNMPIWVLCLIPGSGPGAALPLEATGYGVRSLLCAKLPERPWVVLLSTLLLLSYLSLSLGFSLFRLLCLSGWGRVFIGWVRVVSTQGVSCASVEVSDPVAPPLNLVLYMHLRIFA